jgi:hypothetical protein
MITRQLEASMTLDDAITEAISLRRKVENGNLAPVFATLKANVEQISQEMDLATLLPGGPNAELGMAAKEKDIKGFYAVFKARIRANMCAQDGEFSKLIRAGLQGSVGAVVTALATTLYLPAAALPTRAWSLV